MELMEAIKQRRAIRTLKKDPIPDEYLDTIIEAIRFAPSWANTQCWEVVIVKNSEMKKTLAETLPPTNPALDAVKSAPVVLVMAAKKGLSGFYKGKASTDKGDWFMFDVGLATQNLSLAAHSLGLGSVIVGLFDAKKAEKILNAPNDIAVVALIPLGFPLKIPSAPPRKEKKDFVKEEHF
ncbi:MAG: nitroreductase family protein [Deltaproteobacteria bacterium]|nr:nitroreductase family protein [Deltaproteobacteria bacterium]